VTDHHPPPQASEAPPNPSESLAPTTPALRTRRASVSEPAAILETMELLKWVVEKVGRLPRSRRYGLGSRVEVAHLDVLEELTHAQYSRGAERVRALDAANRRLQVARLLVRLCYELRHIDEGAAVYAARKHFEIGQQVGAWRKASASTESSSPALLIPRI